MKAMLPVQDEMASRVKKETITMIREGGRHTCGEVGGGDTQHGLHRGLAGYGGTVRASD